MNTISVRNWNSISSCGEHGTYFAMPVADQDKVFMVNSTNRC